MRIDNVNTNRLQHFHPSLIRTLHLAILVTLLTLALCVWLAMPLLSGIVDKARQTSTVELPALTRSRHDARSVELLYGYINALYWVEDPFIARKNRLQAQVLIHGFEFPPDSALAATSNRLLVQIQGLSQLRQEQSDTLTALHKISAELSQPLTAAPQAFAGNDAWFELQLALSRFAGIGSELTIKGHDWHTLAHDTERLSARLHDWAPRTPTVAALLGQQQALLQQQLTQLNRLTELASQADQLHAEALQHQLHLAELLNSGAALRAQQLADAVENDARQVRHYTLILLAVFALASSLILFLLNYFIFRPIMNINRALRLAIKGEECSRQAPRTLFHELNTICASVRQYGSMTHKLQLANQELKRLSQQDGLTGLANRHYFDAQLASEHARACRYGHSLCLILFDLDHFKRINDRYGHLVGDECLRRFANTLQQFSQRSGDLAARYGGEEFALILPNMTLPQAQALAERIRAQTEALPLEHDGEAIRLTLSGGLVHTDHTRLYSEQELLLQADQALYCAKQQGRNHIETTAWTPTERSPQLGGSTAS